MKFARQHAQWVNEDAIHFITTTTHNRVPLFESDVFCQVLWDELFFYADLYKVNLISFVIMPDHFHLLAFPRGDKTFSDYMRGVKSHSAKLILTLLNRRGSLTSPAQLGQGTPPMRGDYSSRRTSNQKQRVWQPEFFDNLIYSADKLEKKLNYVENNPVEEGLVSTPEAYRWLYINPKLDEIEL